MSRLKIKDMPPVEVVDGTEIIPTGGKGDVSVTVERVKNYVLTAPILSSLQTDLNTVDLRSQNNEANISSHVSDLGNPHQVTKAQVGLGNVDNTSDAEKPLSTAAQTAITNLTNTKADVTYIDGLLASKANITYVDAGLSTKLNATSNAVSASKLETTRTISTTGDATWSTSFDGSANATGILTLANSGVVANTYGNSNNVPQLTLDAKGRVTSASTVAIPTSSTTVSGLVQLNDTVSSTSTSLAATANSVKITYDLANAAIPSSQKGVASGVATLDVNTLVPTTQLPQSTTSQSGIIQLNNTLTSTSTSQALTAAQGKVLNDKAFGVDQTYQDFTSLRSLNTTYTNTDTKARHVIVQCSGSNISVVATVGGIDLPTQAIGNNLVVNITTSFIVPPNATYKVVGGTKVKWVELKI